MMILLVTMEAMAPAEAPMMVLTQATPIAAASPSAEILAWDPALKRKETKYQDEPSERS